MNLEKYPIQFKSSLLIISFLFIGFSAVAQNRTIDIKIKQGRNTYSILELDSLVLKKKKFAYLCTLSKDSTIHLYHSVNDSLFNLFKENKIDKIESWPYQMMAEEQFNSDYELLIADHGWSSWFYSDNINWHRFDAKGIRFKNGKIIGKKTIRRMYPPDRKPVELKNWDKPVYVIIAESVDSDSLEGEIQYFHLIKLLFED